MAKIVKFLLPFLFVLNLYGASYSQIFSEFDNKFTHSTKIERQNLHNKLKNLYLKTSGKKYKNEKMNLLYRLIYSSKELGYSSQSYEKELTRLGGNYKNYAKKINNNQDDLEFLKKTIPKNVDKAVAQKIKTQKVQTKEVPAKKIEVNKVKKIAKIDKSIQLKLISVEKQDGKLQLQFNREVDDDEMKKLILSSKDGYRNVLDFKALKESKVNKISNFLVDEIRIAQFDKDITRVVFRRGVKFDIDLVRSANMITIETGSGQTSKVAKSDKSKGVINVDGYYSQIKNKIVVIDPGHGGKDPGGMGNDLKEKDIVLSVAKMVGEILKKRGYNIYYTRTTDKFINLKSRTAFANKKNADMFISIHANAAPNKSAFNRMSGVETFFLSPARSERSKNVAALENKGDIEDMNHFSQQTFLNFLNREKIIASNKLAIDIQKYVLSSMKKSYTVKDGGVREAPFWVLVGAQMPAILIELGYITHKTEGKNLGKTAYQKKLAEGIANGVDAYFIKNN